jgi:hypothetical protein
LNAGAANAEPQVGTSAAVQGDVFITAAGQQQRAELSQQISLGDEVLTKQQSALQILLLDASIFTVGENCQMTIDRFVYDPDAGAGEMSASIARGAFRFMSGRVGGDDPTQASISTPSATIGIRGTFLDGVSGEDAIRLARYIPDCDTSSADREKASLIVLRGPGTGSNTLDTVGKITVANGAGSSTIDQANYAVFVPGPDQAPCGPFELPEDVRDYLDFYLRSAPSGPPTDFSDDTGDASDWAGDDDFYDKPDPDFVDTDQAIIDELEQELPPPPVYGGDD